MREKLYATIKLEVETCKTTGQDTELMSLRQQLAFITQRLLQEIHYLIICSSILITITVSLLPTLSSKMLHVKFDLSNTWHLGVAPAAKIVFQDISVTSTGKINTDVMSIFNQAYKAYARVHSNSWGCGQDPGLERRCNRYETYARTVDKFM